MYIRCWLLRNNWLWADIGGLNCILSWRLIINCCWHLLSNLLLALLFSRQWCIGIEHAYFWLGKVAGIFIRSKVFLAAASNSAVLGSAFVFVFVLGFSLLNVVFVVLATVSGSLVLACGFASAASICCIETDSAAICAVVVFCVFTALGLGLAADLTTDLTAGLTTDLGAGVVTAGLVGSTVATSELLCLERRIRTKTITPISTISNNNKLGSSSEAALSVFGFDTGVGFIFAGFCAAAMGSALISVAFVGVLLAAGLFISVLFTSELLILAIGSSVVTWLV